MKTSKGFKRSLIALTLLVATNAFAVNKGSLHVSSPESVLEKQLGPGDYIVRWEDTGSTVELTIMQGRKVVATAPAKVIPLEDASTDDSVVLHIDAGGRRHLWQIFFSGKRLALEIKGQFGGMNVGSN
jgi:hypothetical protein